MGEKQRIKAMSLEPGIRKSPFRSLGGCPNRNPKLLEKGRGAGWCGGKHSTNSKEHHWQEAELCLFRIACLLGDRREGPRVNWGIDPHLRCTGGDRGERKKWKVTIWLC